MYETISEKSSRHDVVSVYQVVILDLQPRDKAAMLVVKTKEIFLLNLHQNRVHFPAERNAFVLDHQHGRRDVTCKPAISCLTAGLTTVTLSQNCVSKCTRLHLTEYPFQKFMGAHAPGPPRRLVGFRHLGPLP